MSERVALKIAIDLMHVPSQVRLFRSEPLPEGVPLLLRIAAGDNEADRTAVELTGRSIETVQRAAAFFIEQILFAPEADSYRVLGASRQASAAELRRNVGLLLKWLHPDVDPHSERSVFVGKVTGAWNNLKTPDRRAAYDELRRSQASRGRPKAWRRNQRKQLAAGMARQRGRDAPWTSSEAEGGFFRRALSALFHRPPQ
jgi:hypothetical protein